MAKRIAVIGTGYVGLIQAVGLADFGNTVVGVDIDAGKVASLANGEPTIFEHDLQDYLKRNVESGRLTFTTDSGAALSSADVVFLAMGTPPNGDGSADLSQFVSALPELAKHLTGYTVIAIKSTVPVGTNAWFESELRKTAHDKQFDVVSNPEFLREGRAIYDFFHPDRVVIGSQSDRAHLIMEDVYRPLYLIQTPFIRCTRETAELIKYASNAFLATKIAFINEIANLSEAVGADVHAVAKAMGMDGRISSKFLHAGPGFGGSCFPKDSQALVATGERYGVNMSIAKSVLQANEQQKHRMVGKLKALAGDLRGKTITLLGCTFKSETDDVRESPAIVITEDLLRLGAQVRVHDPKGLDNFEHLFGSRIAYVHNEFQALRGADAAIILTEWNEYRNLDLSRAKSVMNRPNIVDTRNVLDANKAIEVGFRYDGVGRCDASSAKEAKV